MNHSSFCIAVSLIVLTVIGCSNGRVTEAPSEGQNVHDTHVDHEHGKHASGESSGLTDMEKMKAELAKLSPDDAASAMKQHFCPVSGEMLGTMGAPIKVDVDGREVWICCEGCRKQLLENPDEYLAKLNN